MKPGRNGFNVYAKVTQSLFSFLYTFSQVVDVKFEQAVKANGEKLDITEALVGDDTGVVKFRVIGGNILTCSFPLNTRRKRQEINQGKGYCHQKW